MIPPQKPVAQELENLAGRRLKDGEYLIQWMLSQGSTSKVYLVSHPILPIPFAVKQVCTDQTAPESAIAELDALLHNSNTPPQSSNDAVPAEMMPSSGGEFTDRFLREALFLARLQHPTIPALYDYFSESGYWYLVMDYISGHSLTEQMRNHCPMPPLEALGYAMQLCNVLDYLHRQTPPIIFRDLQPSNILLKPDSSLVLIDFGLARYFNEHAVDDTGEISLSEYAAPEQYRKDRPHDTRSDLYSLGVILYEMLTGQRPQEREDLTALQSINPPLSYALSGLVKLALRADPDQRFQSAYTLYLALERVYNIEERRVYQHYVLAQMGNFRNEKEPFVLPAVQLESLKDEDLSVKLENIPHTEAELLTALPLPSLEQRRQTREALHRAHQEHLAQTQPASVDESQNSLQSQQLHSPTPKGQNQNPATPPTSLFSPISIDIQQNAIQPKIILRITPWRIIQGSFLLAIVVFLVFSSLLVYKCITPRYDNDPFLHPTPTTPLHARPTQGDSQKAVDSSWQVLPSPPVANADNATAYIKEGEHGSVYMHGGYLGSGSSFINRYDHHLYRYDIDAASWEIVSNDFPAMVNNAAAVDEQANIFFTAGYSPDTHMAVSALYIYQPKNGLLQKINAPAQIRLGFGNSMLADQQGHLYITQGFMQAGNPYARAGIGWYRYDIATQQWYQLASLPAGLGYAALTSDGRGGILLLGGTTDAEQHMQTNKIYRYNIVLNAWTQQTSRMPQLLSGEAACQVWPDQMVFVGGYNTISNTGSNSTWLLNTQTLDWQKLSPLPRSGSLLGAATCDGNGHLFLTRGAETLKKPTQDFWMLTVERPLQTR